MTGYRMFSKYHLIRETTKQEKSPTGMMVKLWSKVKSDFLNNKMTAQVCSCEEA